ncbi:MAG: NADH:flavin oxidoreductase [Phenylobacterium sp.]|uniref:oxidoreductase n=1 Tax=Phenylobacterium sp. TaxID=1871053 RepID=UPI0025D12255|nr:2,4-dienoyl-CoA reductase [Phenylobacterium sp.]MBI1196557.1 NADH:flavin oxidoreductase [Phenylobacterium sp.]
MISTLASPLALPCGAVLPNRLAKAAMSEGMADPGNHATQRLETLYRRWARSGAGLLFSGNIQVDRWHLERPANVVLDDESGMAALARMAAAGKVGGAQFWAQLSHTGRQVIAAINPEPLAPSAVEIDVMRGAGYAFARPRAMTEAEIGHAIDQFAEAAVRAKAAGFDGVILHGAHGYLISQFLSPHTNRRQDRWGGSLANRARFLLAVVAAVRKAVGPAFPIGLKLNASDFQKGAFTHADSVEVVRMLNDTGLDLLELSGGSLEQPKVVGVAVKDEGADGKAASTARREAYFLAFAGATRAAARMPVMVTGGFRTRLVMAEALAAGELDVVGLGRPMIAAPETPARLLAGEIEAAPAPEARLELLHMLGWFNMQLERLGDGLDPDLTLDGAEAAARFAPLEAAMTRALMERRGLLAAGAAE